MKLFTMILCTSSIRTSKGIDGRLLGGFLLEGSEETRLLSRGALDYHTYLASFSDLLTGPFVVTIEGFQARVDKIFPINLECVLGCTSEAIRFKMLDY